MHLAGIPNWTFSPTYHVCSALLLWHLIGLQEDLGTPALAFTRAVCEVLKLDASLGDEVAILRRNLLRMTQTREFGEQAGFKVGYLNNDYLFLSMDS